MQEKQKIVCQQMREALAEGATLRQLVDLAHQGLGLRKDANPRIHMVAIFRLAFAINLKQAHCLSKWKFLGGTELDDDDIEQQLKPFLDKYRDPA